MVRLQNLRRAASTKGTAGSPGAADGQILRIHLVPRSPHLKKSLCSGQKGAPATLCKSATSRRRKPIIQRGSPNLNFLTNQSSNCSTDLLPQPLSMCPHSHHYGMPSSRPRAEHPTGSTGCSEDERKAWCSVQSPRRTNKFIMHNTLASFRR